jgi:hypothetical protein
VISRCKMRERGYQIHLGLVTRGLAGVSGRGPDARGEVRKATNERV